MTLPDLLIIYETTNCLASILRRFLWSGVSGDPHADRSRRTSRESWGTESMWIKASICLTAIGIRMLLQTLAIGMMSRELCNAMQWCSQVKKPLHHGSDIPNWSKGHHFIEDSSTNNTLKQIKDSRNDYLILFEEKNDRTLLPFGLGKCVFPVSFPLIAAGEQRRLFSSEGPAMALNLSGCGDSAKSRLVRPYIGPGDDGQTNWI